MAKRTSSNGGKRIEPRFSDAQSAGDGLRAERRETGNSKPTKRKRTKKSGKRKPQGIWLFRLFKWFMSKTPRMAYWSMVAGLWGFIGVLCIFGWYGAKLPNASSWEVPDRPPNVRIVGNDQALLVNRGVGGAALRLEDMSPWMPQAVIAIEDHRFHAHFGFDPIGFTRAMTRNILGGRMREGGSTITQQLAKNLFLKPDRTFARKVQELIIAFWLEAKYSKTEILELYLNRVYFGAGAYGVDAASRRYFGKPASHIDLQEAAMLAGLLKAPSAYSPARHPKRATRRAKVVLAAMKREGYVKPGDLTDKKGPVITTWAYRSGPEHFVADMVMKRVKKLVGKVKGDVTVETTISPYLLTAAQGVVRDALKANGKQKNVGQAALVTLAPDGAIRALIGGRDYGKSQFNRAVDAKRQPGSAFKTFVWQAAMDSGYRPESVLIDEPIRLGRWTPENYDRKFRGPVTLSESLATSLNTIAVKLVQDVGAKRVARTAHRMGVGSRLANNASIALGTSEVSPLEMAAAYAPYANGGLSAEPYLIYKITDANGKVLYKRGKRARDRLVHPVTLGRMNGMLSRVVNHGTGKRAKLRNHFVGGKTGTSQESRDAWFVGYSAHLVTAVWFGNDDNKPMKKMTGGGVPAQAWKTFMQAAHHGLQPKALPGDGYLLATLPDDIPLPTSRPRQSGDPIPLRPPQPIGEDNVVTQVAERARKTIMDLLFE